MRQTRSRTCSRAVLSLLLTALAAGGAAAGTPLDLPCPVGPIAEFTEPNPSTPSSNSFGFTFAVGGDLLVVGDPSNPHTTAGSAAVYRRAGQTWSFETMLIPPAASAGARFGAAVAIDGATIAVGAPHDDDQSGAVYLYTEADGWDLQQKITAATPVAGARLGSAVALAGDVLAAGAPLHPAAAGNGGAVLLAQRAGGSWSEHALLTAEDAGAGDRLGTAVALDGDRLLAGAPYAGDRGEGAAYFFDVASGAQLLRLTAADAGAGSLFGTSVALRGERALIGAPQHSGIALAAGAAWIFEHDDGTGWSRGQMLTAPDPQPLERVGSGVALGAANAYVGATHRPGSAVIGFREVQGIWQAHVDLYRSDFHSNAGRVVAATDRHVYCNFGFSESWEGIAAWLVDECEPEGAPFVCRAADPIASLSTEPGLASAVAVTDELFALGQSSDGGRIIARLRTDSDGWGPSQIFIPAEIVNGDRFGASIAADGGRVIVGAPDRQPPGAGCDAGGAYIYERVGETLVQTALLEPPDSSCASFGVAVALDGDRAAVGATGRSSNPVPGTISIFELRGGVWSLEAVLTRPDGRYGDGFGRGLDMDGSFLIAGAVGDESASLLHLGPDGWQEVQRLVPQRPSETLLFGRAVSISLPRIAIGSRSTTGGAVHLFRRIDDAWSPTSVITGGSSFGWTLSLDADRLAVGSFSGIVVFGALPGGWAELVEIWQSSSAGGVEMHGSMLAAGGTFNADRGATLFQTTSLDCNGNDLVDGCEIAAGLLSDSDGNGVPDICEAAAGDVNGDGSSDIDDLVAVVLAWGPCPPGPCPADLDGNGAIDVNDLLIVLLSWTV